MKTAPPSGPASTLTLPPWAFMISATMARPSPAPCEGAALPRQKRSKIRARSSWGTPGPWSLMSMLPPARVLTVTSLRGGAWTTAFSTRLRIASSMA